MGEKHRSIVVKIAFLALLASAGQAAWGDDVQSFCESCQLQLGLGGTYHFWGPTGGVVVPLTLTWSHSRYEAGLFRVTTDQTLDDHRSRDRRVMANPYWGVSLSRRWELFERGPVVGFVGFGLAGKTESDALSITRWDFASQFGVRIRLPGNRAVGELSLRHWSNGGIRLPNHGQDFATVMVRLNPGMFAGQQPLAQLLRVSRSVPADNHNPEEQSVP